MEFLSMGMQKTPFWLGIKANSRNIAESLLDDVRAEHLKKRKLGELSGGELQRVLLALAIQINPDILMLDEPDAGVDASGSQVFCELLENLRRNKGFTQLMVSHDLGMVAYHANHVICLNRKVVAEGAPAEVFKENVLSGMFGPHLGTLGLQDYSLKCSGCKDNCCPGAKDV
jgi:zinc transport system ATP-binding protein